MSRARSPPSPLPNAGYPVRGVDETLEHVAAGRGISFLARSASVFYSHPDVVYVPIPDLAPDQVCLAVAASHTSPVVDDFVTAAQSTAEVTAECGNYEMWQLGGDAASRHA
ncbi:LysR substrate-binding domain-containing protein [Streptomyces sp. LN590]|uniref:LysR substrate-binding domain-containing protein n=1 Tax=Streptomyces sp. LN590 TaxID=3112980 RepID=UPI003722E908